MSKERDQYAPKLLRREGGRERGRELGGKREREGRERERERERWGEEK